MDAYDENGDMIARDGQKFRQVGWQINGGTNDGLLLAKDDAPTEPHGGFSPVYVEVGD